MIKIVGTMFPAKGLAGLKTLIQKDISASRTLQGSLAGAQRRGRWEDETPVDTLWILDFIVGLNVVQGWKLGGSQLV